MYAGDLTGHHLLSSGTSLCLPRHAYPHTLPVFSGQHCFVLALLSWLFGGAVASLLPPVLAVSGDWWLSPPWVSPPGRMWALRCFAPTPPACSTDRVLHDLPRGFENLLTIAHAQARRDTRGQTDARSRDAPDACRVGTGNHLGTFTWRWLRPLTA